MGANEQVDAAMHGPEPRARICMLGPPQLLMLDLACVPMVQAFGGTPYLVGSTMKGARDYRDVDVRLILSDKAFKHLTKAGPDPIRTLNLMGSTYLTAVTGLPVDFQFQSLAEANAERGPRNPLGRRWLRG